MKIFEKFNKDNKQKFKSLFATLLKTSTTNNYKNLICYGFIFISLMLIYVFCIQIFFNDNFLANPFIFSLNNLQDYFADFFNQVRISYYSSVYQNDGYIVERALPPLQYVLLKPITRCCDFNQIPTLFFNGISFSVEVAKSLFVSSYIFMVFSVMFFILFYESLKFKNKFFKILTILVLMFSYPFLFEYQRGNILLLAVLATSFFLFNYQSENKKYRNFAILALSFAIALKPLPILLLILLFFEKRYKDILLTCGVALGITLLSFIFLGGMENIPLYFKCLVAHQLHYKYVGSQYTYIFVILAAFSFLFKENWKKCFTTTLLILICVPRGYNFLFLLPVVILFLNKETFSKIDILFGMMFIALISPIHIFDNVSLLYFCEIIMISNLLIEKLSQSNAKNNVKCFKGKNVN